MREPRVDRRSLLQSLSVGAAGSAAVAGVASGASTPFSVDCTLLTDAPVEPGERARIAVTVRNESDAPARVRLEYAVPALCCYFRGTCSITMPPPTVPRENVVPESGDGEDASWTWDALPAGASRRVTVAVEVPEDADGTVETPDGAVSLPTRWTVVPRAETFDRFAATARSFALFFDTDRQGRRASVGDDVIDMYESAFEFAGKRIGRQYRDALEAANEMGSSLQTAGTDRSTKFELEALESDRKSDFAPSLLVDKFETLAENFETCRDRVSAGDPAGAARTARTAVDVALSLRTELREAPADLAAGTTQADDAEAQIGQTIAAAEAFTRAVAGADAD